MFPLFCPIPVSYSYTAGRPKSTLFHPVFERMLVFLRGCSYIYIYIYIYHHHVVPLARMSLTLSRRFSLSFIASDRSSGLHPVSSHSCCIYVLAGRPAFSWPYVGLHRSASLMSWSPSVSCVSGSSRIVFVMGDKWPYSWCFKEVLPPGLIQYCSQHSRVIAV